MQTTLQSEPTEIYLQVDDQEERRLRIAELAVANARYYGGAMKIAPDAKFDDGFLTSSPSAMPAHFDSGERAASVFWRTLRMDEVTHVLAKQVNARPVKKDQEVRVELDGEAVGRLPATFEVVPRALRLRCP